MIPQRTLEALSNDVQAGQASLQQLVETFLETVVIVPSGGNIATDPSAFQPVLIAVDGEQHVAVFGTTEGAQAVEHLARYAATMRGGDLIDRIRPGVGILVSIRATGFNLSPKLVEAIRISRASHKNPSHKNH